MQTSSRKTAATTRVKYEVVGRQFSPPSYTWFPFAVTHHLIIPVTPVTPVTRIACFTCAPPLLRFACFIISLVDIDLLYSDQTTKNKLTHVNMDVSK